MLRQPALEEKKAINKTCSKKIFSSKVEDVYKDISRVVDACTTSSGKKEVVNRKNERTSTRPVARI